MEVICNEDGSTTIHCPTKEAALLAGRTQFGNLKKLQTELVNKIAEAWYAAGCPREKDES